MLREAFRWKKNWNVHFIASPKISTRVGVLGVVTSMLSRPLAMETSVFVKDPGSMNRVGNGRTGENIPGWSWTCLLNIE
jgi:hypothetical protein